jgi:preprotein translocase subunit SecA
MVQSIERKAQRGHYFVIVDEVDSILIDEARTPLIISAPDMEPTDKYYKFAQMIEKLNSDTDFIIDEKVRSANLTEHGITRVEKIMGVDNLYETDWEAIHHIENALKAKTLYLKDRDYVVKDGQIIIVDEFTGRLMVGRRWSDGMHQAVEAKESVDIKQESKTMATISFQNYFRMYEHLSGMTATAATEAEEFQEIYKLNVVVVPTNEPMVRKDHQDAVYKTLRAKYTKIVNEIQKESEKGRPVLVGTTSIGKNEIVSKYLKKKRVSHNVLNAKNHEKEAIIIAEAGKPGAVTVATNMAGRGVDIVLGGAGPDREDGVTDKKYKSTKEYKKWLERHNAVIDAGGLHVIGTERHESRRIDNQLRGRSGRQGDPGSSRFFLSLEDDLMRIFGGDQIGSIMSKFNLPEDQPIENKLVSRAIGQAQVKVEGFHFDARKNVVEYDDVANQQREIIYKLRNKILEEDSVKDDILDILESHVERLVVNSMLGEEGGVDAEKVMAGVLEVVPLDEKSRDRVKGQIKKFNDDEKVKALLFKVTSDVHTAREKQVGGKVMRQIEKFAYLGSIDNKWVDHIDHIDGLRQGVRLRGYAQKDPVAEFKNEAFELFETLLARIDEELTRRIFRVGVRVQRPEIPLDQIMTNVDQKDQTGLAGGAEIAAEAGAPAFPKSPVSGTKFTKKAPVKSPGAKKKVGRNDPCPCGSGKKYKKCHYPEYG